MRGGLRLVDLRGLLFRVAPALGGLGWVHGLFGYRRALNAKLLPAARVSPDYSLRLGSLGLRFASDVLSLRTTVFAAHLDSY